MAAGDRGGGRDAVPLSRRELGRALRRMREEADVKLDGAARALGVTPATVSRWENGRRLPQPEDVRRFAALYAEDDLDEVARLVDLAERARRPGWWESYGAVEEITLTAFVQYETAASHIDYFSLAAVPAILQTRDYAAAVLREVALPATPVDESELPGLVEVRMRRQSRLAPESGLTVTAILDEYVLRRPVGGSYVLAAQIEHLAVLSRQTDQASIRVLPFDRGGHPGQQGAFTLLRFNEEERPDLVYQETQGGISILDRQEHLDRYRELYDHLWRLSLDEASTSAWLDESARLIRREHH